MVACNAAQVYAYKVVDELGTNNTSVSVGRKEDKLTHSKDLKPEKGDNCYECSRYVSLDKTTVVYYPPISQFSFLSFRRCKTSSTMT